ncbi:UNVERIFIED_CONTAM: hypothetical protein Sradi_2908700 [Sesamum radiatum]|uniref:Uncharacterized protein n=1 Tax=Sesamum radiatum TaxID=300843 RepID=A0AAW2RZ68_SESRA
MELWDMQEFRHLEVIGSDLPVPTSDTACLPNLLTLVGISGHSCTKEVLGRIPHLKKLGIQIKLAPAAAKLLCCFDHLAHLHQLESLKCFILNPSPRLQVIVPPLSILIFPPNLKKLTLSGLVFPWKYMRSIAQLPSLEVLKLQSYAFQGRKWRTYEGECLQLKFLLLEDTNVRYWSADSDSFHSLDCLIIRHCYKCKRIPWVFRFVGMIELVDCDASLVAHVMRMRHYRQRFEEGTIEVCIRASLQALYVILVGTM